MGFHPAFLRSLAPFLFGLALLGFANARTAAAQPALKKLPPPGIDVDRETRDALLDRIKSLGQTLTQAVGESDDDRWRTDVDVLLRAVYLAVTQNLFFKKGQLDDAQRLLDEAERRIGAARNGDRGLKLLGFDSDESEPQPLVGGFISGIDDSVQPFGIVVPANFSLDDSQPHRMDVWLHGRGDTKTEVPFLTERMNKPGLYTPPDTFVVHPFGRHCNAFKFAGETDVYEVMRHVESLFRVDHRKIAIRGFSMGGAGCWHLAVHDPARWFAANPGAGFVDTIEYQGWSEPPFAMTPSAKKLLHWYDVLPWTQNLVNTNTIAYSGEVDKQKKAADRVVARASKIGLQFPYVIGKKMGHKIDDDSQQQIEATIQQWANDPTPSPRKTIDFVTYTLRYSRCGWVNVTGMEEHWTAAAVKATLKDDESLQIATNNITHLEVDFSESGWPNRRGKVEIEIDGQTYSVSDSGNLRGFQCRLAKADDGEWTQRDRDDEELRKRPGMQGPIDDAFCDRFVFVLPSRPAKHGRVQRWIDRETAYARDRWARLMRGDVRVVLDRDLTEDQIETCHLICFGDFTSNRFLFNVSSALPIQWTRETLKVGEQSFDPVKHAPIFCYPNPVNPRRYLVVNSGMTFREFSNNSNSRQIAMLPDWAVVDVTEKNDSIYPGKIEAQGFFDESWSLPETKIPESLPE